VERTYALVEQLDLALEQLAIGTPTASRFALILVDNVVELVLHTSCETEILFDDSWDRLAPKRYNAKARAGALGKWFGPKVEFCVGLKVLSRAEAEFIRDVHEYRNELYHTGIHYDDIILPLAWEYFGTAADLLPRMRVAAHRMADPDSPRVTRYFPGGIWDKVPEERVRDAALSLRGQRVPLPKLFADMLSAFATHLVQEVQDDLDFLASDNPQGWDEQRAIFEVQLLHYAFEAKHGPQLAAARLPPGVTVFHRLDQLRAGWQPEFRSSPVSRWGKRAELIREAPNSYGALARFQRLRREMQELANMLREAARSLDAAIQMEIDRLRDK
jgi:hypothetical protein